MLEVHENEEYQYKPTIIHIEGSDNGAVVWFENDLLDIGMHGKKSRVYEFDKDSMELESLVTLLREIEGALCGYSGKYDKKRIKIEIEDCEE